MPLPHLRNSVAGVNKFDPVHNNIFEVAFTVPAALRDRFSKDDVIISQHITKVSGLNGINKHPETATQKFMGTDRSYIKSVLDSTRVEIECTFTLNLRNDTENYVYNYFRAWSSLGYDTRTGARALKRDYTADFFKLTVDNRAGQIYHEIKLKDVMMNGDLGGIDEYDYSNGEAVEFTVKFVSDWWDETGVGLE